MPESPEGRRHYWLQRSTEDIRYALSTLPADDWTALILQEILDEREAVK